jgi:hypothetical protein
MTRLNLLRRRLGLAQPGLSQETSPPCMTLFSSPLAMEDHNMTSSIAHVPTASGSRYLQQLCKHWEHSLKVEFTPEHGTIVFPKDARGADWPADGLVTLVAQPETLDVRIEASSDGHLDALKGAVARHIDRFAFREAPLTFDWQ